MPGTSPMRTAYLTCLGFGCLGRVLLCLVIVRCVKLLQDRSVWRFFGCRIGGSGGADVVLCVSSGWRGVGDLRGRGGGLIEGVLPAENQFSSTRVRMVTGEWAWDSARKVAFAVAEAEWA